MQSSEGGLCWGWSSSSSLYKSIFQWNPCCLTINGSSWFGCCARQKKKSIFYIWLLCHLFDIPDMPFSLQYIERLYLSSAGIYFCFKDYPANRMSPCFHHCLVGKAEGEEAANDSTLTSYSSNFPLWNPSMVRSSNFFNSSNRIAITWLIFCLRVNFMEHLGVARHYEWSSGRRIPKISSAILKRDNKNQTFVFILGCCSKHQPAAVGV